MEVNRLRNGYIADTLTRIDIQEISKVGGKFIEIYVFFVEKVLKRFDLECLFKNKLT